MSWPDAPAVAHAVVCTLTLRSLSDDAGALDSDWVDGAGSFELDGALGRRALFCVGGLTTTPSGAPTTCSDAKPCSGGLACVDGICKSFEPWSLGVLPGLEVVSGVDQEGLEVVIEHPLEGRWAVGLESRPPHPVTRRP